MSRDAQGRSTEIVSLDNAIDDVEASALGKIERFVERQMKRSPPQKVVLAMVGRSGMQNISEWDEFEGKEPQELATQILERAVEDSKFQRGVPQYAVLWYKRGESTPSAREWFRRRGGAEDFDGLEMSEGPDGHGVLAQSMRLTDQSLRLTFLHMHQMLLRQKEEITELRSHVHKAYEKQFKIIEVYEQMVSEEQSRRLEMRKQLFEETRKEKSFEALMMLVPLAMKKLGESKRMQSVEAAGEEMLLSSVLSSLTETQIEVMFKTLNPAQSASFYELYKKVKAKSSFSVTKEIEKKEGQIQAEKAAERSTDRAGEPAKTKDPEDPDVPKGELGT